MSRQLTLWLFMEVTGNEDALHCCRELKRHPNLAKHYNAVLRYINSVRREAQA